MMGEASREGGELESSDSLSYRVKLNLTEQNKEPIKKKDVEEEGEGRHRDHNTVQAPGSSLPLHPSYSL